MQAVTLGQQPDISLKLQVYLHLIIGAMADDTENMRHTTNALALSFEMMAWCPEVEEWRLEHEMIESELEIVKERLEGGNREGLLAGMSVCVGWGGSVVR